MSILADFTKKYDTVIFDMDGVITREQQYWNAAALTVWEFLHSGSYYGDEKLNAADLMSEYSKIRNIVFSDDKMITLLKGKGVNSNWDLSYIAFALIILNDGDYTKALENVRNFDENILNEYPKLGQKLSKKLGDKECARNSSLWLRLKSCFQEWFLGDDLFGTLYNKSPVLCGKSGLCHAETPIINGEKLKDIFRLLHKSGIRIGIATGRPKVEMETPLISFGIMEYIDKNALICYDYVSKAELKTSKNLTKPHPYMFVKALLGADYPDERIAEGNYPRNNIKNTLAVGDAGADILAAHDAGMDFCAVLTGVSGKAAREYFKMENAEYILDSLENFLAD